jgi:hypothetical protein
LVGGNQPYQGQANYSNAGFLDRHFISNLVDHDYHSYVSYTSVRQSHPTYELTALIEDKIILFVKERVIKE